jgi:hypothetical protein
MRPILVSLLARVVPIVGDVVAAPLDAVGDGRLRSSSYGRAAREQAAAWLD